MLTVMVVDSDHAMQETLRQFLEARGEEVVLVRSEYEALAMLAAMHVDVVVTSVAAPHMEAVEFARRIRQRCPDVPVLAHAAHSSAALTDHFDMVLHRPVSLEELGAAMDHFQPAALPHL